MQAARTNYPLFELAYVTTMNFTGIFEKVDFQCKPVSTQLK
jgi:hypothetical protein